jgi:hypothetical protein
MINVQTDTPVANGWIPAGRPCKSAAALVLPLCAYGEYEQKELPWMFNVL